MNVCVCVYVCTYISAGKLKGMNTHENQRSFKASKREKIGIRQGNVWKEN